MADGLTVHLDPIGGVVPRWFWLMEMSEHIPSVKPWEWDIHNTLWLDWAMLHYQIKNKAEQLKHPMSQS